jgi:hypothetical protein
MIAYTQKRIDELTALDDATATSAAPAARTEASATLSQRAQSTYEKIKRDGVSSVNTLYLDDYGITELLDAKLIKQVGSHSAQHGEIMLEFGIRSERTSQPAAEARGDVAPFAVGERVWCNADQIFGEVLSVKFTDGWLIRFIDEQSTTEYIRYARDLQIAIQPDPKYSRRFRNAPQCPICNGTGVGLGFDGKCERCDGSGRTPQPAAEARGGFASHWDMPPAPAAAAGADGTVPARGGKRVKDTDIRLADIKVGDVVYHRGWQENIKVLRINKARGGKFASTAPAGIASLSVEIVATGEKDKLDCINYYPSLAQRR